MQVGIAGAGLIGRLLALRLLQQGMAVSIFDMDDPLYPSNASYVAAGMIAPIAESATAEPIIFQLGMQSLQLWPTVLKQLDAPLEWQARGSLIVTSQPHTQDLTHFLRRILKQNDCAAFIQKPDLSTVEPELIAYQDRCVHFVPEAWLDPNPLFSTLTRTLFKLGINWYAKTHVTDIRPYQISTANNHYHFDWVCDCRGLGAKIAYTDLYSVRGEMIIVEASAVKITRPVRLLHPRYALYIVPRANHIYAIGATEIESEDMSPISVRSTLELLTAAYSVHSGFAEARIIQTITHCRPTFFNHVPRVDHQPGLLRINGLYRHGYLLAPVLTQQAEALICSQ